MVRSTSQGLPMLVIGLGLSLCVGFLSGCQNQGQQAAIPSYYPVATTVKELITKATASKYQLLKLAVLDGKREEGVLDTVKWDKELEPFLAADINKPSWKGLFKADSVIDAAGLFITYTSLKPELPVRKLQVSLNTGGQPTRIHAQLYQDNTLNVVEKTLQLDFDNMGGLVRYSIQGRHKVILMDETFFTITGTLAPAAK